MTKFRCKMRNLRLKLIYLSFVVKYIKLNHRFIFTMKDWMSVYVRYEYDKIFESTTKNHDH